ncbi:MAG: heparinase II/III family protein [Candidatus Hydrogenedentes bacterium]|nr:heparinase II/III family protein [Candidatus Hydrogenedentota bacterium]
MMGFIPVMTLAVALLGLLTLEAGATEPNETTVLETLRPEHPRLMLTDAGLAELKVAYEKDATLQQYAAQVKERADKMLDKPALEHRLIGPRLLHVSRECLDRVYTLALAWRWLREESYARAAEANLLTVCAFPDWNPSHFLDTAEMSHAVGVGYDWLHDYLSDATRATVKTALIEKGLKPGIGVYKTGGWWTRSEFNWNQVCNSGMLIGALAIAETDPEYARFIIPRAVASLPKALHAYDPDGAWMEGPGYWHYATRYTAFGLCALDTALGKDFGLSDFPGLRVTGLFPDYTTGPTGLLLNYADSGERAARRPMSCMFWLARKYGSSVISDAEHAVLEKSAADAGHVVWYTPPSGAPGAARDLDRWFRSPVDIVVMRSAWDDPNALFVGVKAGYNQVNHGHLDLGNFELDALGTRWARDLGSDDYNLPGYFDRKKGGKRWKYYRNRSISHNVPILGGEDQDAEAVAKVLDFASRPESAHVTIDLTSAYLDFASNAVRDVALTDNRRAAVVRDRFEIRKPCAFLWGMTTDAEIKLQDDGSATLLLEGRQMIARVLEPRGASFAVESAEQPPPEKKNAGVKRLIFRLDAPIGPLTLTILFAPIWDQGAVESPELGVLDK